MPPREAKISSKEAMVCGFPKGHAHTGVGIECVCCIKVSRAGKSKVLNRKKYPKRLLEKTEIQRSLRNSAVAKY